MSYATKEATFAYLKKFSNYSRDFYKFSGEFFISSLGLGTFRKEPYREENYVLNYKEAVKSAVLNGINHIDTAINYRYQVSEQEIGEALKELFDTGSVTREQLVISSKAGFIPLEFPFPKNPYEWIDEQIIQKALATKDEIVIDQHCLSPKYLRWSVEQSLENLGIETLDILYLHNPETQLGYVEYETLLERIEEAFELFEKLREEGKIRTYGIAAWNGFLYEEGHKEYISLQDIVKIAQKVGGEAHGFKYVQSPYNMAKTEAFTYTNQKGGDGRYYTLMQVCAGYGLHFVGSSSLLQLNLFKAKFAPNVGEALGTSEFNDLLSALQFARSSSALSSLFGSVEPLHVKDNLTLAHIPVVGRENIISLFGEKDAL